MIDALQIWRDTLEALPPSADDSWALNFAKWAADRVNFGKLIQDQSMLPGPPVVFSFNQAVFAAELKVLPPVPDATAGISGFAKAWEQAILASTIVASPGVSFGAPSPSTLFSVVASTALDPPSIAAGKAQIMLLVNAPQVQNTQQSEFPVRFRAAFAVLTFTVMGMDSDPEGPKPLTAPTIKVS